MSDFSILKISFSETYILKKHRNILEINVLNCLKHPNLIHSKGLIEKDFSDGSFICSKLDIANFSFNVYIAKNNLSTSSKIIFLKQILAGINFIHKRGISHNEIKLSNIAIFDNIAKITNLSKVSYEKKYDLRSKDIHDYGILFSDNIEIENIIDLQFKNSIKNFIGQIFVDESVRKKSNELLKHSIFETVKNKKQLIYDVKYSVFDNHRTLIKIIYKIYTDNFEEDNSLDNSCIFFCAVDILYRIAVFKDFFKENENKLCISLVHISAQLLSYKINEIKFLEISNTLFDFSDVSFIEKYQKDIILKLNGALYNSDLFDKHQNEITKCISSIILNNDSNTYIENKKIL